MTDSELSSLVCEEARHVIDLQVSRNENYDRKAVRIFRSNLFLVGLLLTGLSITFGTNSINTLQFINIWGILGLLLSVTSSSFAAVAYTSSSYDLGISEEVLDEIPENYSNEEDFRSELRIKYKKWMSHNNNVSKFNSYLITTSIISAYSAIVLFVGATVVGIYNMKNDPFSLLLFGVTLIILTIIGLAFWFSERIFLTFYPE